MRLSILVAALAAAGCSKTDLGSPCHLIGPGGAEVTPAPGREYLFLGSAECENFVCTSTGGPGYCSTPCSGPGDACGGGLTCGSLAIDAAYLDAMRARMTPAQFAATFGGMQGAFYCVR